MKKILIKDVASGDVLARDVRDPEGKLLFAKGTELQQGHIESLSRRRIKHIFVEGRELPEELQNFDTESLKLLESEIEARFHLASESEVMRETLRVSKKIIIGRALRSGDILTKSQLTLVSRLKELPPPPALYQQLSKMINDPRTTAQSFGKSLAGEPVFVQKIIDLVNSPFYKFPQKVGSIENVVSLIGMQTAADLILIFSIISMFKADQNPVRYIIKSIWAHCLGAGILTRIIGKKMGLKNLDEIFTAAILHDFGKIIIASFCPEDYFKVEKDKQRGGVESVELEKDILGYTHVNAGKVFAERWKLPNIIQTVMQCHHTPYEAREYKLETALVHIANVLSHSLHYGKGKDLVPDIEDEAWSKSKLQLDDIEPIMNECERIFDDTEFIFLRDSGQSKTEGIVITVSRKK